MSSRWLTLIVSGSQAGGRRSEETRRHQFDSDSLSRILLPEIGDPTDEPEIVATVSHLSISELFAASETCLQRKVG